MNPIADRLHAQVTRLREARDEVERLTESLKRATAEVERLGEIVIPELLEDLGTEIYRLPDGREITIKRDVLAGILVDQRADAHDWLDRGGHGGMIQRTLVVDFDKGEVKKVAALRKRLIKAGFDVKTEEKVNPSTLRAWARRRAEAGEEIPDSINITPREWADVKTR